MNENLCYHRLSLQLFDQYHLFVDSYITQLDSEKMKKGCKEPTLVSLHSAIRSKKPEPMNSFPKWLVWYTLLATNVQLPYVKWTYGFLKKIVKWLWLISLNDKMQVFGGWAINQEGVILFS